MSEIIDKYTILKLKSERITDPEKLSHVQSELNSMNVPNVGIFERLLYFINSILWDAEDKLRECESRLDFGPEFILLARSVYFTNDMRNKVKNHISKLLGEEQLEVKSYSTS
jgi:hypothetical protein